MQIKLSHPLTKAIQTTEGVLVVVSDIAVGVTSAVDPSTLPHKWAAVIITAQNAALLAQRGVIKAKAAANILGLPAPGEVVSASTEASIVQDVSDTANAGLDVATHVVPESAQKASPEPVATPAVAEPPATPAA